MANEFIVRKGIISLGGIQYPYKEVTSNYTVDELDYLLDCVGVPLM